MKLRLVFLLRNMCLKLWSLHTTIPAIQGLLMTTQNDTLNRSLKHSKIYTSLSLFILGFLVIFYCIVNVWLKKCFRLRTLKIKLYPNSIQIIYLQERSFPQRGKHAAILLTQTMLPSLGYTS